MSKRRLVDGCRENASAACFPENEMLRCSFFQWPHGQCHCLCWGRALSIGPQTHLTDGSRVLLSLGDLESEQTWVRMPAPPLAGYVTLGSLFCLCKPQFCHL